MHGSKLEHFEFPAVQSHALLRKKQRTGRCQLDEKRNEQIKRRKKNQNRQGKEEVEDTLENNVTEVLGRIKPDIDEGDAIQVIDLCIGLDQRKKVRHNSNADSTILTVGHQLSCETVDAGRQAQNDVIDT